MLHTEFRRNRPAGSGEEIYEGFLSYLGIAAILVYVTSIILINFHFHLHDSLQNLVKNGSAVSEKNKF